MLVPGLVGCAIAGFVVYALLARFVVHGPVSASSLAGSVTDASGSAGGGVLDYPGRCRRLPAAATWRCVVMDGDGSGGAASMVRLRAGSSCWDGALVDEELYPAVEAGLPPHA